MIEHSQSHMLNNKIKICVGLAGKSYMLHPLERADFFFFSANVPTFTMALERTQQF